MGYLAEGTKIAMADGTEKAIENIQAGDIVKGQLHKATVLSTTLGRYTSPMISIKTNGGLGLMMTDHHPVITANGIVNADQLKPGMKIQTPQGPSDITSLTNSSYNGNLYALKLDKGTAPSSDFFANGILVGDAEMSKRPQAESLDSFKDQPPEEWHKDYTNQLKDDTE